MTCVSLTRREKTIGGLDLRNCEGIEIGPLAAPQVTRQDGRIFYVDHADTEELRRYYANHSDVDVAAIVDVDGVWGDRTLRECIGSDRNVDYAVACHVIEHVPDLLTWLEEVRSVLKPRGSLRLVIPDKNYTFDYLRPTSTAADVLSAYVRKDRKPQPRTLIEYLSLACDLDVGAAWRDEINPNTLVRRHSLEFALRIAQDAVTNKTYHDAHCWVFTPKSFAHLAIEMARLGLFKFALDRFFSTSHNELEFFVHLVPCDNPAIIESSFEPMIH